MAGDGFTTVEHVLSPLPRLKIRLDREKIQTVGRPALGNLIRDLHIYRCIKDVQTGSQILKDLTSVDSQALEWWRVVDATKRPRPLFLQANTEVIEGNVVLKEYLATKEGLIQSWVDRQV